MAPRNTHRHDRQGREGFADRPDQPHGLVRTTELERDEDDQRAAPPPPSQERHALFRRGGLADHLEVGFLLDYEPNPCPDHREWVDHDDADGVERSSHPGSPRMFPLMGDQDRQCQRIANPAKVQSEAYAERIGCMNPMRSSPASSSCISPPRMSRRRTFRGAVAGRASDRRGDSETAARGRGADGGPQLARTRPGSVFAAPRGCSRSPSPPGEEDPLLMPALRVS